MCNNVSYQQCTWTHASVCLTILHMYRKLAILLCLEYQGMGLNRHRSCSQRLTSCWLAVHKLTRCCACTRCSVTFPSILLLTPVPNDSETASSSSFQLHSLLCWCVPSRNHSVNILTQAYLEYLSSLCIVSTVLAGTPREMPRQRQSQVTCGTTNLVKSWSVGRCSRRPASAVIQKDNNA